MILRRVTVVVVASLAVAFALGSGACSHSDPLNSPPPVEAGPSTFTNEDAQGGTPDAGLTAYCPATGCPYPFATCPSSRFPCDVNLENDPANCGSCGFSCDPGGVGNASYTCSAGKCLVHCRPGTADCNGLPDDDCEITFGKNGNCNACGDSCLDPAKPCIFDANTLIGACGCTSNLTVCDDGSGGGPQCIDTKSDDSNCGKCGKACDPAAGPDGGTLPPNMYYGCSASTCGHTKCAQGFADCDGNLTNGCEESLLSTDSCGSCTKKCAAGQVCRADPRGTPTCMCPAGQTLCGYNYCTDISVDPHNCGACGVDCTLGAANQGGVGFCDYGSCNFHCGHGFGDCNGDPRDGCEVNLLSDQNNCGTCGHACDVLGGQPCIFGSCAVEACGDGGLPR